MVSSSRVCVLNHFAIIGIPLFVALFFFKLGFIRCCISFFFLQIEDLWQPYIDHGFWCRFSNSTHSLFVSVSHFGNSPNISNFFTIMILVTGIGDQ